MHENETLSAEIGKLLAVKGKTLALAESCTGGYISHLITLVPGASSYFKGSIIAYDNEIKILVLGVSKTLIGKSGAVSVECAEAMAKGILTKFNVDYAISTTGIAGPTGATPGKPVGTVCIALATKEKVKGEMFQFRGNRQEIIEQAALKALALLEQAIMGTD